MHLAVEYEVIECGLFAQLQVINFGWTASKQRIADRSEMARIQPSLVVGGSTR